MGLFNRKRPGGASWPYEQEHNRAMVPRWTTPPDRNTAEWIKAFNENPRMAVIERIASDLSFATGKLYVIDAHGDEKELSKHPFLDFWQAPNPLHEMSNAALWRLQEVYLKLKGEGYFIIEKDTLGRPAELWPLPTHWVQMTPYLGYPFYRVRLTNGTLMEVSVDDMFVMKDLDPIDPYKRGQGQAESLADEIETDEYAAKFQKKFFYNDATPNLVIAMPKSSDDQRKRFRAEWMERFQGMFKSHGVATVNGELEIHKIGENMKDMDMIQGRTFLRNAALEHFGVPREIMGITESSNRATSEAAQFIYAQNVLMPNLRRREEAINTQLIPHFGDNLIWRFDDIVPRNQEFDKSRALEGWNAGLLTKDEARELLDMPAATSGGDIYKTQFSDVFIHGKDDPAKVSAGVMNLQYSDTAPLIEGDGSMVEITDGDADSANDTIEITNGGEKARQHKANRLQAVQRATEMAQAEETRRFEMATLKFMSEQAGRIAEKLGGGEKAGRSVWDIIDNGDPAEFAALDANEQERLVNEFINGLADWKGEEKLMQSLFEPLWREAYQKGAVLSQNVYNIANVKRPELISTAKLNGGARIKNIQESTKKNIARIITTGLENGDPRNVLAKQIEEEMSTSAGRARVIAAQECNASLNAGSNDMMKRAGASFKTWHVTNMTVARNTHKALNGKTVPIDEPFISDSGARLMHPCDPNCENYPGDVINCHCFLTYDNY